jgi:hypothetical protein
MKTSFRFGRILLAATILLSGAVATIAQVPQLLNYQGRIAVNGTNFTGTGQFKFALISTSTNASVQATATGTVSYGFLVFIAVNYGGSGYTTPPAVTITDSTGTGASAYAQISGGVVTNIVVSSAGSGYSASPIITIAAPPQQNVSTSFWSNDGTSNAGGQPATSVPLPVTKGLYSVLLGDTTLSNMATLPASVFANPGVWLRVWFNDGTTGFQLLTPDQRLAAVGYAIVAGTVADGSITASKIAAGAVGSSQLAPNLTIPGTLTVSNLVINGTAVTGSTNYSIPNGTNVQTYAGGNYFVTNFSGNFILPTIVNVGDAIKLTIPSSGGSIFFNILQNPGQRIVRYNSLGLSAPLAANADGTRLLVNGGQGFFISTNFALTWNEAPQMQQWLDPSGYNALQISGDGSHIFCGASFQTYQNNNWNSYPGLVFSGDYGKSWNLNTNLPLNGYQIQAFACSTNGLKAVAVANYGGILTSTDGGSNWVLQTSAPTNATWTSVASSADGTKLVATRQWDGSGGGIYTSGNSGSTWTQQTSAPITNANWTSVASSADGTKLVATRQWDGSGGGIYTSGNSGSTWTQQLSAPITNAYYSSVASSADGTMLVAATHWSELSGTYTSANSGSTWIYQTNGFPNTNFSCERISISSNGSKLSTLGGGQIFTSVDFGNTWTPCLSLPSQSTGLVAVSSFGTAGGASFNSLNNNTLTLVYLGNGLFIIGDGNGLSGH